LKKAAETELDLAAQAHDVMKRRELPSIRTEPLADIEQLLAKTIDDVSEEVTALINNHLDKHGLEPNSRRWIKYGVDNNQADTCPFCDQDILGRPLTEAYAAYFSDAFSELSHAVEEARNRLSDEISPSISERWESIRAEIEYWKRVCVLPIEPKLEPEEIVVVQGGINLLLELLDQKIANPLLKIDGGPERALIVSAFASLQELNSNLDLCKIEVAKARKVANDLDMRVAQSKVAHLDSLLARSEDDVTLWVERYNTATSRRAEIVEQKKNAQEDLRKYATVTVGTRQSQINEMLDNFGANFSIVDTKANFKGREPNAEFSIEIAKHKISVGEKKPDEPSFGTVLSSGDKTTLALAFFLTQALADSQLDSSVVVFDDPFNSQDLNRQFETTSQIRALSNKAGQTIVFSHDPRFLNMIAKDSHDSTTSTYQLRCKDNGDGAITRWLISDTLKELYVRQSEIIREFATHGQPLKGENLNSVKQAIRPFLEDYIRARFPARFEEMDMLYGMIETIEKAGSDDPLHSSLTDLIALNEYTRPNMHGGGAMPEETELRANCKKVVRIVGRY